MLKRKQFEIQVLAADDRGGRILINTPAVDRDRDRVMPSGCRMESYLKNPVVQWGHNYREPWSTIGRTKTIEITPDGIVAEFELRPAANDQDPQNIVRLLWEGGWVKTASIGFIPKAGKPNDEGGYDFSEWELLEWSLVPIPANQEALRLAVKGIDDPEGTATVGATCHDCGKAITLSATLFAMLTANDEAIKCVECLQKGPTIDSGAEIAQKRGRVLSARNEQRLREAVTMLQDVLSQVQEDDDEPGKSAQVIGVTESSKSTDAAPEQATDPMMLAGDDGADAAAAAERELAETLRAYFKTVKEVLA